MADKKHLELARKGRDVWNKWRRENSVEAANFSRTDFTRPENRDIVFTGFEFGDKANFSDVVFGTTPDKLFFAPAASIKKSVSPGGGAVFGRATFGEKANFEGATFGDKAKFVGATFGEGARFAGAKFGNRAQFAGATFGEGASFQGATFGEWARFADATFGAKAKVDGGAKAEAKFDSATFEHGAKFHNAKFEDEASFRGATFGGEVWFHRATFENKANFEGATFGGVARFSNATFRDRATFNALSSDALATLIGQIRGGLPEPFRGRFAEIQLHTPKDSAGFQDIHFRDARFLGPVTFIGRVFHGEADFARARFDQPPDFRGTENHDQLNWTDIRFAFGRRARLRFWTTDPDVAVSLRRLRKIASDIHAHDAERDLFILERMAERGIVWRTWHWRRPWRPLALTLLMFFYRWSSNCGRSVLFPFFWLIGFNVGFGFWYLDLSGKAIGDDGVLDALTSFTLAGAVPFFGASRAVFQNSIKTLFCETLPDFVHALTIAQGVLSGVLIFLIALALRVHFKVR